MAQQEKPRIETVGKASREGDCGEKPNRSFGEADAPSYASCPVVAIGASAGGLAAFEAFLSGIPDGGALNVAFVLIQHLAPDHRSCLSAIVQRYTRMRVLEVEDGMPLTPGCAYIIPPNCDMSLRQGTLQLTEPRAPRGQRMPIDHFFRSLAQDRRELAIGVVLSGTGSDGALGVVAIKDAGGLVLVQEPSALEFDGMPRSAIRTGIVDYVLPPSQMGAKLLPYVRQLQQQLAASEQQPAVEDDRDIARILSLLTRHTGHDFSPYKPSTVGRRIARRMMVCQVTTTEQYCELLEKDPAEGDALLRDMLIGVTSFFRDPDVFGSIESLAIPALLHERALGQTVRVWVPACSTGEEAYSIAILFAECQAALDKSHRVQIFATDIDTYAIAVARAGVYSSSAMVDVSPERLERFFSLEPDGRSYRVQKRLRDMLIFSEQNAIKDPPFSRLDLISCRNLLIYLGADVQKKVISLFHYALNPNGLLVLGTSETVGESDELFETLDRKAKIYRRSVVRLGRSRPTLRRLLTPTGSFGATERPLRERSPSPTGPSLRDLTEQALLQEFAGAGALVNGRGDILYLHGRTGLYLEPTPGETGISNILRMARDGLRHALTAALHSAVSENKAVDCTNLTVRTNGHCAWVSLAIRPLTTSAAAPSVSPLYLVVLQSRQSSEAGQIAEHPSEPARTSAANAAPELAASLAALRLELQTKDDYLRSASEELETTNEELRSTNEEMQSVNEELQSTNEELETSKEELQSLNEELSTVNAELQTKIVDLTRVNNDMNNLLAGTGIGTVFVDHQLRIIRFTPAITRIINLIPSDAGRPIGHIVSNLVGYDRLVEDSRAVLDTLVPCEVDVQTSAGAWYAMRILPYRTLSNVVEGVVITFVDITTAKLATQALSAAGIELSPYRRSE